MIADSVIDATNEFSIILDWNDYVNNKYVLTSTLFVHIALSYSNLLPKQQGGLTFQSFSIEDLS